MSFYIRKNTVLSLLWGLWIAALVAHIIYDLFFYLFIVPALFLIFTVINVMFKKKINSNNEGSSIVNIPDQTSMPLSNTSQDHAKNNTIIAAGTQLKGNINLDGNIQIYGVVMGDIIVNEGSIRLMRSGQIEGNLTAPHITVDGRVEGVCISDDLEILEHGRLKGIVKGSNFSIKKGGIFVGQSEITEEPVSQVKSKAKPIIAISQEKTKVEDLAVGQHSSK
ncbi:bactofilin family protein [Yersinia similis]|uniref:Integral membrane protein CcmA involved in cell shape determination n=1 Tax=Yersinia similis TaxID=367190 RepID=A0A0T9QDP9_9GAMM|nr:polymer-forming cytoskeletal protein [Yersinia similis]CNF96477.1 Integral membrane protein CcmA involved in cell shape determination [Yersinia similis]CNI07000.1 Integral membrane protein CcmA involved in cell shape determination [Yersinia similis]